MKGNKKGNANSRRQSLQPRLLPFRREPARIDFACHSGGRATDQRFEFAGDVRADAQALARRAFRLGPSVARMSPCDTSFLPICRRIVAKGGCDSEQ